jgi:hypothetical protein
MRTCQNGHRYGRNRVFKGIKQRLEAKEHLKVLAEKTVEKNSEH